MRFQTDGDAGVVMATKMSSVPMVTENLGHKQTEGRHRRDRKHHAAYAHHRKSAVELLEASKAEYVKSSRVLNNKQELKHPENLCVGGRDGVSISPPSNTLLDEIAYLQAEKVEKSKAEIKLNDFDTTDSVSAGSDKKLKPQPEIESSSPPPSEKKQKSPVNVEEVPPPRPERKKSQTKVEEIVVSRAEVKLTSSREEIKQPPPKPERTFISPGKKEEIPPPKPEKTFTSIPSGKKEEIAPPKPEKIFTSIPSGKKEEIPPPKPEKTFTSISSSKKEETPPPKPERKPRSPSNKEQVVIEADQSNHSKPDIPPRPSVPPKPSAASKPVIPPRTVTESNKFAFAKPKTPPKPTDKPVPPPRPDKAPNKRFKETIQPVQTAEMSELDKTGCDRKDSLSNKSANSSNQDQQTKRYSSVSAGASLTLSKDQCDGEVLVKGRSPASASSVRSRESRLSAHSDNFLKPLCATNNLSTSVGFLVEKKHTPIPKPRTEKQLKEKQKELPVKRQLHRSHSDLSSCRHSRTSSDFSDLSSRISRTSTEVERFFSEMGIDRTVLDPMLRLHANTNDNLDSFSSLDSQEARSVSSRISCGGDLEQVPAESEQDLVERSIAGTSVVERNARIIKWLCNVKKAKNPNVTPKQNKVANI